jgi:hypothetical protein
LLYIHGNNRSTNQDEDVFKDKISQRLLTAKPVIKSDKRIFSAVRAGKTRSNTKSRICPNQLGNKEIFNS